MSKINVNTWEPESGTAATLMATGDTVTVPSGASLVVASGATINITGATQTGFPSAGFAGVHADVSSGSETYTVPAGITKLVVYLTGAGGGGAGGDNLVGPGSGGGGAGTVIARVTVVAGDTITIAIGAGGNGGAQDSVGNIGGDSTFTHATGTGSFDTITGPGGLAGVRAGAVGAPVAPTIGASNEGIAIKGGRGSVVGTSSGGTFWGPGGVRGEHSVSAATVGDAYGSGGGGGSYSAGLYDGAAGAVGACFIMEFK